MIGDTTSCLSSSFNYKWGVQSCSICSKTGFSTVAKHADCDSSAHHVQVPRAYSQRDCRCFRRLFLLLSSSYKFLLTDFCNYNFFPRISLLGTLLLNMERHWRMHMVMCHVGWVSLFIVCCHAWKSSISVGCNLQRFRYSFIEDVEHACGLATLQMGEFVSNVSTGIDTYSIREPLGICAGICPFDFPAMIPLWVSLVYASNFTVYLSLVLGYSFSLVSWVWFLLLKNAIMYITHVLET